MKYNNYSFTKESTGYYDEGLRVYMLSDSKYGVEARQHLGPKKWFFVGKNQKKVS